MKVLLEFQPRFGYNDFADKILTIEFGLLAEKHF